MKGTGLRLKWITSFHTENDLTLVIDSCVVMVI